MANIGIKPILKKSTQKILKILRKKEKTTRGGRPMAKLGIKRILRPLTTFPAKTKNTKDLHCKNKFCRLWGRLYQRVARHILAIVTIAPETIKRHRVGPTVKRLKAAIFLVKSPKCSLREGGGFVKLQRGRTNGARLKTGSDLTVVPSWRENTSDGTFSGKY